MMKRKVKISSLMRYKVFFIAAVMLASGFQLLSQDTTMVRGMVRSSSGDPVPNVSIGVEGSSLLPVITDSTGTFETESDVVLRTNPDLRFKLLEHPQRPQDVAEIQTGPMNRDFHLARLRLTPLHRPEHQVVQHAVLRQSQLVRLFWNFQSFRSTSDFDKSTLLPVALITNIFLRFRTNILSRSSDS